MQKLQPKIFLFENVRGLLSHDGGKTFQTMQKVFEDCDYIIQKNSQQTQTAYYKQATKIKCDLSRSSCRPTLSRRCAFLTILLQVRGNFNLITPLKNNSAFRRDFFYFISAELFTE
ncbi:MAG: DNA cytosine methyltransferase [Selenomonadaceae bacterium]|nr:DNA cytosine methyltransferase [Selenomonadaceae bacterium]